MLDAMILQFFAQCTREGIGVEALRWGRSVVRTIAF